MTDTELTTLRNRLRARYHVERLLGRGGMGAVYLARDLQLDRPVALKVLPTDVADDHALRNRFLHETRLAASFSHPNIVPVHAVEEQAGLLAFTMGFVEGESLAERVARNGPLTGRETVGLLQDVAYALAYAHARGVVHRDIKPDNIMIERATGRALVMDFGLARRASTAPQPANGLTRVGEVVGTPEYMSPEQATADAIDGRSDLYSLGLVAWFALTGRTAMAGGNPKQVLVRQLTERLPPIVTQRSDLPGALAALIDRCLAKEPDVRFPDAAALVDALEQSQLAGPEIPLPVRMLATELGTIGMVLLFALLIGWFRLSRTLEGGNDDLKLMVPIVIMSTLMLARLGQALAETQRLAKLGFDSAAVLSGLRSVVDEAEGLRAAARVDDHRLGERRRVLRTALLMLVLVAGSIVVALSQRRQLPSGLYRITSVGIPFLFNGLACLCVSFVLWFRSPMRMTVGEWAFRRFWLGGPGRWLILMALRRAESEGATSGRAPRTGPSTMPTPRGAARASMAPTTPVATYAPVADGRLDALEARVQALEAWRNHIRS